MLKNQYMQRDNEARKYLGEKNRMLEELKSLNQKIDGYVLNIDKLESEKMIRDKEIEQKR